MAEFAAAEAAWNAFLKQENATYQAACVPIQQKYWDTFDNILLGTELRWEAAEIQIGWKFGLRWFGNEPTQPRYSSMSVRNLPVLVGFPFSHSWDPVTSAYWGPATSANRAEINPHAWSYKLYLDNGTVNNVQGYWCAYDYGCPYPTSPTLGGGILERDAEAFAVRGAVWIPPAQRQSECALPTTFQPSEAGYRAQLKYLLQAEYAALAGLSAISIAVSGDLVKTAAAVAAEKAINDHLTMSASQMSMNAMKRSTDLAAAKDTGSNLSAFLNYGALFIGVGVLGAALYKGHRS